MGKAPRRPHGGPAVAVCGAGRGARHPRCRGAAGEGFRRRARQPECQLFEAVRDYLDEERKSGRHAVIAAYSEGSADRLATVLREHGLGELCRVADGKALARLPRSTVGLAILPLEQGLATDNLELLGEKDILG